MRNKIEIVDLTIVIVSYKSKDKILNLLKKLRIIAGL